jgi:hypothetical protein
MTGLDIIVWVLFAIAQYADVRSTNTFLPMPEIKEKNWIWHLAQVALSSEWWIPRLILVWGAAMPLYWWKGALPVAVIAVIVGAVAARNYWLIRKYR